MEEFYMQIVMYIGLGALLILGGYWVGLIRLLKAVKAGYAERDHKIRSLVRQLDELAAEPLLPPEAVDEVVRVNAVVIDGPRRAGKTTLMTRLAAPVMSRPDLKQLPSTPGHHVFG